MRIRGFYSDPHYGHANSIKYCDRPFADVDDMTEKMVALYNEYIDDSDTCVWMGDCYFGAMHKLFNVQALMARLRGRKVLTLGNHDMKNPSYYLKLGFDLVFEKGFFIEMAGRTVYVNHYPASAFHPGDDRYQDRFPILRPGEILMHGHTHEKVRVTPYNALHAGVDAWGYRPALWEEMEALVKTISPEGTKRELAEQQRKDDAAEKAPTA